MTIKNNLNLIRGILYLDEVIHFKSISRAAEENHIKAANLSTIIGNLEKYLNGKLITRSPRGCAPTALGLQVAQYACAIAEQLQNLQAERNHKYFSHEVINVYMATNLELYDYSDFSKNHPNIKLDFVDDDLLADIKISNLPPYDTNAGYTKLAIGNEIKQNIWITCNEQKPQALEFFDFIVAKLFGEYNQSEP